MAGGLVPDVVITFVLDGTEHKLSFKDLPLGWWTDIKNQAGFTPKALLLGLGDADVDALVTLIWVAKRKERSALTYTMVRDRLTAHVSIEITDIISDGRSLLQELDEAFGAAPAPVLEEAAPPTTAEL